MIANKQTYSNLYQRKLSGLYTIQSIISFVTLLCLESIYLFGASWLLSADVAYFFIVVLLSLIVAFKGSTNQFLYRQIRPKVSIVFFQNITNIIVLIFSSLCIVLLLINPSEKDTFDTFGLLSSIILMLGLPLVFYSWLVFKKTNQKVSILAADNSSLRKYFSIEAYLVIVLVALFGIIYDFIPQKVQFLLWTPLIILALLSFVDFLLNNLQIRWVLKAVREKDSKTTSSENYSLSTIYEINPYNYENNLKQKLINENSDGRLNTLNTVKQLVAVDFLPVLIEFRENYDMDDTSLQELNHTISYLQKVKSRLVSIENNYEFVEQSSDIILIKALLRTQITEPDKNLVIKLLHDSRNSVKKAACIVAGYHDDINFISVLIEHLGNSEVSIWAQFGLKNIGLKAVKYLEIEFSKRKNNLFFVEACFEVLSEIKDPGGHNLLFAALNEPNKNIKLIAAKKIIRKISDPSKEKRKHFGNLFDELIINQLTNIFLLKEIDKKNETFYQLKKALKDENDENAYFLKNLVQLYYNPTIVKLLFSYYGTKDVYEHAFCNHLIDLLFHDNYSVLIKMKILFSPEDSRLIELIEEEFPNVEFRKNYRNEEDLVWHILKMDYDRINNWTRACAINTLQYMYSEDIPFELAAEFLNQDKLLKETAAICIYKNIPEFYTIFLERLEKSEATKLDFAVRSNVDFTATKLLREDNLLLFDKIQFLISIPYLKELSIHEINTFETFFKVKVLSAGSHSISVNDEDLSGYWIVESGQITFSDNGRDFSSFSKREIFEVLPISNESGKVYFTLDKPARFLIIKKLVMLNILKETHNLILIKIGERSDFYSNLQVENILNQEVA